MKLKVGKIVIFPISPDVARLWTDFTRTSIGQKLRSDWGAGTRDDFTGLIPSKISPDITTGDSPVITRYRWISPDITRSNIIHQDVVWSWSSHQSAVWPIWLCCKWRRILMFFLHRASIYWICTPVPLILLFWADARFERPFPRFMFLFHKPLRICAAAVFINPSGADFPVPYVLP